MQIHRLLEIVYILLEKRRITAQELAGYFGVSPRTIYRDLDVLSSAGIPVYAVKGQGGGICLMEGFVLNKTLLSEQEQLGILASLQGLKALHVPDIDRVLEKLSGLFVRQDTSWLEVDFSRWGSSLEARERFAKLKTAIINKQLVTIDYHNSQGAAVTRRIEPLKLLFKGQSWYVYGFCQRKQAFRLFKLSRMQQVVVQEERFQRTPIAELSLLEPEDGQGHKVTILLQISEDMAYRVYDEFAPDAIYKNGDGSFNVTMTVYENEWVYGYILSYGEAAQVLEPGYFREIIIERLQRTLKGYEVKGNAFQKR